MTNNYTWVPAYEPEERQRKKELAAKLKNKKMTNKYSTKSVAKPAFSQIKPIGKNTGKLKEELISAIASKDFALAEQMFSEMMENIAEEHLDNFKASLGNAIVEKYGRDTWRAIKNVTGIAKTDETGHGQTRGQRAREYFGGIATNAAGTGAIGGMTLGPKGAIGGAAIGAGLHAAMGIKDARKTIKNMHEGQVIQFPSKGKKHDVAGWAKRSLKTSDGDSITATGAFEHYVQDAEDHGTQPHDFSTFKKHVGNIGLIHQKIAGRGRYVGVKLNESDDDYEQKSDEYAKKVKDVPKRILKKHGTKNLGKNDLNEMTGKGKLGYFGRKKLVARLDKKLDDEQVKTFGHKFNWKTDNPYKLTKNAKYNRLNRVYSKLRWPEMYSDKHLEEGKVPIIRNTKQSDREKAEYSTFQNMIKRKIKSLQVKGHKVHGTYTTGSGDWKTSGDEPEATQVHYTDKNTGKFKGDTVPTRSYKNMMRKYNARQNNNSDKNK